MASRRAHKRQEAKASEPPPRADSPITHIVPKDAVSGAPDDLPEELIAARAYEKWTLRGCPMGQEGSQQDWYAARAELEAERLGWAAPQAGDDKRSASK